MPNEECSLVWRTASIVHRAEEAIARTCGVYAPRHSGSWPTLLAEAQPQIATLCALNPRASQTQSPASRRTGQPLSGQLAMPRHHRPADHLAGPLARALPLMTLPSMSDGQPPSAILMLGGDWECRLTCTPRTCSSSSRWW